MAVGSAVFLLLLAVFAGRDGVDGVRALTTGVHGTVVLDQCTISDAANDPRFWTSGWDCWGAFTGDGGRLRIGHVNVFLHADHHPGPVVSGRVSGPAATWAWPDRENEWMFALALAAGLPAAAWWSLRAAIEVIEPVGGWPRKRGPASSGKEAQRPAQMGNRARRRRRRR